MLSIDEFGNMEAVIYFDGLFDAVFEPDHTAAPRAPGQP